MARRAFSEGWVDAEPRPGKRDGAFCMGIRADESRILQNYKPAFGAVSNTFRQLGGGPHGSRARSSRARAAATRAQCRRILGSPRAKKHRGHRR